MMLFSARLYKALVLTFFFHIMFYFKLMVPVTFGHPWLRHSNHLERVVVSIDVVQVSEPAVCALRLSV